jgi:probable phosphoglycerate mutase
VETAEAVAAPHGLPLERIDDLGEFHPGVWEGHDFAELDQREDWRRFNSFRTGTRPSGGESILDTQVRMVAQVERMRDRHPDQTVAIISHGDPLRVVVAYYLGIPLDLMLRFELAPASLSVMELNEWGPRVLSLNRTYED